MIREKEIYASDDAWEHWFEKCAVGRCAREEKFALRRQIESAFFREVARYQHEGVSRADYEDEDICSLFDAHFWLYGVDARSGRRSSGIEKPLKEYYYDRIDPSDNESLKKIICGTFFSKQCGLIKDVVRESVQLVKGWQPRWTTTPDGKKILEWVKPLGRNDDNGNGEDCIEDRLRADQPAFREVRIKGNPYVPIVHDDANSSLGQMESEWRPIVAMLFDFLCENGDKTVPILVYAMLYGISPQSAVVQRLIGVKQGRCYEKYNRVRARMAEFFKRNDLTSSDVVDTAFLSVLRREAARRAGRAVIDALHEEIQEEVR